MASQDSFAENTLAADAYDGITRLPVTSEQKNLQQCGPNRGKVLQVCTTGAEGDPCSYSFAAAAVITCNGAPEIDECRLELALTCGQ